MHKKYLVFHIDSNEKLYNFSKMRLFSPWYIGASARLINFTFNSPTPNDRATLLAEC